MLSSKLYCNYKMHYTYFVKMFQPPYVYYIYYYWYNKQNAVLFFGTIL
jgi:hypothetical protein